MSNKYPAGTKVHYVQQVTYCGKVSCKKCQQGIGHGPYWYSYRVEQGKTKRSYIGKSLPSEDQIPGVSVQLQQGLQPSRESGESVKPLKRGGPLPSFPPLPSPAVAPVVRVLTFGRLRVERWDGQRWQQVVWRNRRVRKLFASLLAEPVHTLGREQVIELLWPDDEDVRKTAGSLDRAIYELRQHFPAVPIVQSERGVVMLADASHVWIDVDVFRVLLTQAHQANANGSAAQREQCLQQAVAFYAGPFLSEESYLASSLSLTMQREGLQRAWTTAMLELIDLAIVQEAVSEAIELLNRLLLVEPANETAVQRLMRLLGQQGRRSEAISAYRRLRSVLRQDFQTTPMQHTREVYDTILQLREEKHTTTESRVVPNNEQAPSRSLSTERSGAQTIGRSHQYRLVGRNTELVQVSALRAQVAREAKLLLPGQESTSRLSLMRGPVQGVVLMGEIGVGKTRLAEEMARQAQQQGWAVAWSRSYEQEGMVSYRVWVDILRWAVARSPTYRAHLLKHPFAAAPLTLLLPELQDTLPRAELPTTSFERDQVRLWEAVVEVIRAVSEQKPLLLVIDDLHWCDSSSCELLGYLLRRIHGKAIFFIGTYREHELSGEHPFRSFLTDLQRERILETVAVRPLSDEQIGVLVAQVLGGNQEDAGGKNAQVASIAHVIETHAGGNPFFAEELARIAPFTPSLAASARMSFVPETITAVLDLRVARLSQACQKLLGKAAILGGSFVLEQLVAMEVSAYETRDAPHQERLLDLLEEALAAGILGESPPDAGEADEPLTYHFWHPLLVSYLYEKLSAGRRLSLHRRAAEMLCEYYRGREQEEAATITHHLVRGGAPAHLIVSYAELAARHAHQLSAFADAEYFYRITLDALSSSKAEKPEEHLHRAYVLTRLSQCVRARGMFYDGSHLSLHALEVAQSYLGEYPSNESASDVQLLALLHSEAARGLYDIDNYARAEAHFEQALQLLSASHLQGPVWATVRFNQAYVKWRLGNIQAARKAAEDGLGVAEHLVDASDASAVPERRFSEMLVVEPIYSGQVHVLLGNLDVVEGLYERAMAHYEYGVQVFQQFAPSSRRSLAIAYGNIGDLYMRKGDFSRAEEVQQAAWEMAHAVGDESQQMLSGVNLGIVCLRRGRLEEAEQRFREVLEGRRRVEERLLEVITHSFLSLVLQEQGNLEEAQHLLVRSLAVNRPLRVIVFLGAALVTTAQLRVKQTQKVKQGTVTSQRLLRRARASVEHALRLEGIEDETRIEGWIVLASIFLMQDEPTSAKYVAQDALSQAQRIGALWLVPCALRVLALIAAHEQRDAEAQRLFAEALQQFEAHGMHLEYTRTQSLAAQHRH